MGCTAAHIVVSQGLDIFLRGTGNHGRIFGTGRAWSELTFNDPVEISASSFP